MGFSTKECAWKHISIKILGRTLVGIRGFEFQDDGETDYLYGAGDEPIDIQEGNKSYPGNLRLLKYEVDMLNDAAMEAGYLNITRVPHEAIVITVVFKKRITDPTRTITAVGVKFNNLTVSLEQNAKMVEMTVPFKAMKTILA